MAEDEMPPREDPAPEAGSGTGVRPGLMFRWGLYVSLGVLAVLAVAAAVYTTRAVLVRVLIALFIAVSLDPAVRALVRRGMRRSLAVLVIFLIAGTSSRRWCTISPATSRACPTVRPGSAS
jgi:hypothetical protein